MREMETAGPFDRVARRRARDRAAALIGGRDQVLAHVEAELTARAALLPAPAGAELRVGLLRAPPAGSFGADPSKLLANLHGGTACEEDARAFGDGRFARIMALMTLHGVNDLPGALILYRRALVPGGRFLAVFPAGLSLGAVRQAFLTADSAAGRAVAARVGPTVDPAQGAALLQRAGFADPVGEVETLRLRVANLAALARDVRAHGDSGWLAARARGLTTPRRWAAAEAVFAQGAEADGRVPVAVELLYLSGRVVG